MESITIVICTYANPIALRAALQSLERQRVAADCDWSVLVVDNNSMDLTAPVVNEFIERQRIPQLRLVAEPQQGLSFARRRAVLDSRTDILAFVDDDCILEPDWVAGASAFFTTRPRAGAVGGHVQLVWESEPAEVVALYARAYASQDHGDVPVQAPPDALAFLVGAGLAVRRTAVLQSRWLDGFYLRDRAGRDLSSGGDSELVLRIRRAGYEVWYTPELRLAHCIARERMTLDYLCRMSRGFGESEPALWVTAHGSHTARALAPLLFLGSAILQLARACVRFGLARAGDGHQRLFARVTMHRQVGRLRGALSLVRPRRRQQLT